jgi:uncharacterized protein (TIRG00374 family)
MIANKQDKPQSTARRLLPWLNLLLVVLLIGIGIWYLSGKVSLTDILDALRLADPLPILAGVAIMLITVLLKAWRWRLMFAGPQQAPSFSAVFWALMLGQYVNLIVPFFRLGEVARIYALNRQTSVPMAQSIGTLVVEKVLDLFILVLTIAAILPFVILPEFVGQPGPLLWSVPLVALLALYVLAFQTALITQFLQRIGERFPYKWLQRPLQWAISGLEGLSALRSGRTSLLLVGSSALIGLLSILLPYVTFAAFDLPLGLLQAALIHVVVTIVSTPPSTPGKIGVFNGAVAIMLYSFGISSDAIIVSYSIVFHLVVILPQILLGSIAAAKTDWRWHDAMEQGSLT